jgi:phosphoglycolate phosphatase
VVELKTVLFWDIDGTLLTTGRAGIFAWEDAALEVTGKKVDLDKLETAGLTDPQVAARILEACGVPADPETARRMTRLYENRLPASLPRREGKVMPGVREILEHSRRRADVLSLLLTGNTRAGAGAKLAHYGLADFFSDGAFSDDRPDRPAIARAALEMARRLDTSVRLENVYVIGDTPHDIHCGQAIGARCVAVASGPYSVSQLEAHRPWWAVERLPAPAVFAQKLGLN